MATFRLFIDVDNAAFDPDPNQELARILTAIAADLTSDLPAIRVSLDRGSQNWLGHYQTIFDVNGNDVGRYAVKKD